MDVRFVYIDGIIGSHCLDFRKTLYTNKKNTTLC